MKCPRCGIEDVTNIRVEKNDFGILEMYKCFDCDNLFYSPKYRSNLAKIFEGRNIVPKEDFRFVLANDGKIHYCLIDDGSVILKTKNEIDIYKNKIIKLEDGIYKIRKMTPREFKKWKKSLS